MQEEATFSVVSEFRGPRSVQLARAGVLLLVGLVVTFTAPMHSDAALDASIVTGGLVLIGLATAFEYYKLLGTSESWWVAARSFIAFAAAGACLAVVDSASLALVIAVWAALTALITLMRLVRGVQARRIALPSLLLSVALAVAVLLTANDPVAVIGFFGAYALIRGVFLGISAFDTETSTGDEPLVNDEAVNE